MQINCVFIAVFFLFPQRFDRLRPERINVLSGMLAGGLRPASGGWPPADRRGFPWLPRISAAVVPAVDPRPTGETSSVKAPAVATTGAAAISRKRGDGSGARPHPTSLAPTSHTPGPIPSTTQPFPTNHQSGHPRRNPPNSSAPAAALDSSSATDHAPDQKRHLLPAHTIPRKNHAAQSIPHPSTDDIDSFPSVFASAPASSHNELINSPPHASRPGPSNTSAHTSPPPHPATAAGAPPPFVMKNPGPPPPPKT